MLDDDGTRQNHKKEGSAASSHITAFKTKRMARADDVLPISACRDASLSTKLKTLL